MKLQENRKQTAGSGAFVHTDSSEAAATVQDARSSGTAQKEMQHLADNSPKGTVQAKFQSLADTDNAGPTLIQNDSMPIQRVMDGEPRSVIHMMSQLTIPQHEKLQRAIATLVRSLEHDPNINLHQLIISVEQEGGIDRNGDDSQIAGSNPALTSTIPAEEPEVEEADDHVVVHEIVLGDAPVVHEPPVEQVGQDPVHQEELPLEQEAPVPVVRRSIEIVLQRPFVAVATEGELLGLLAHEVGVHNIPSDFRNIDDSGVNQFAPVHTPRKADKANTDSGGYEFHDWPLANAGQQRDGAGRQHDHLMVADVLRNPPEDEQNMALTRANVYLQTVLNIGDRIWESEIPLNERRTQTSELIHLYLVDIARIVASDDGRMPPREHAIAINDIYGRTFTQVLLPLRAQHQWIPAGRPKANIFTLGISLISFIRRVESEKEARG